MLAVAVVTFIAFFAIAANAQVGVTETPRTDTLQVTNGEVLDSVIVGNQAGGGVSVQWIDISDDNSFMFVAHGRASSTEKFVAALPASTLHQTANT